MSRKRILNLTSRKKRDTYLTFTNTNGSGASTTPFQGSLTLNGANQSGDGTAGYVIFRPTARNLTQFGGTAPSVVQEAMRTATTCYIRGYGEHIRVQTSSAVPWLWRRIVFASKYSGFWQYGSNDTPTTTNLDYVETSNGYKRAAINQQVNNAANTINQIDDVLFKGAKGVDWQDRILAPVDTRRVDLRSDRTFKLHSGNQSGYFTEKKLWYPVNRNIVYDDDENGETENSTNWSAEDKRGVGNIHIVDLFSPLMGATSSDLLSIQFTGTVYWHEK